MKISARNILPIGLLTALWLSQATIVRAKDLTVQEIVDRAIERSESQLEANVEAKFESLVLRLVDSVDGEGKVTKTEKTRYSRYPLYGALFEELVEKENRPLTEKEAEEEKKRRNDFIKEVRKRIAEGKSPQPEDARQVRFDSEFMSRYQTRLIGEESLRGHSCWVVYLEPRKGKLPVKRRMDEALNRSTGKLWISQDDFGLVRVEFEMREPIRYLAGLLATLRNTVGQLEFEQIERNIWFPVEFELQLDLRILFKNIRRNIAVNWSGYRRADAGQEPLLANQEVVTQ